MKSYEGVTSIMSVLLGAVDASIEILRLESTSNFARKTNYAIDQDCGSYFPRQLNI